MEDRIIELAENTRTSFYENGESVQHHLARIKLTFDNILLSNKKMCLLKVQAILLLSLKIKSLYWFLGIAILDKIH